MKYIVPFTCLLHTIYVKQMVPCSSIIQVIYKDKNMRHISWLACASSHLYILNIARTKIDFPSPSAKVAFVNFEILCVRFLPNYFATRIKSSKFRYSKTFSIFIPWKLLFIIKHSKARPGFKATFTRHFNPL